MNFERLRKSWKLYGLSIITRTSVGNSKNMVNKLDIKKKGWHIILWVTDILCVSDKHIAKSLKAFKMSHLVFTIRSRLHRKAGKLSKLICIFWNDFLIPSGFIVMNLWTWYSGRVVDNMSVTHANKNDSFLLDLTSIRLQERLTKIMYKIALYTRRKFYF